MQGETRPASRFRGLSNDQDFLDRIGFDTLAAKFERRSGRRAIKLYGADVLDWGHKSDELTETLAKSVNEGWGGHYMGHTSLMPELKRAFADFESEVRGVETSPEDIIPVSGIGAGWFLLHDALLEPKDEVVSFQPAHYFWNPATQLRLYGAKAVGVDTVEEDGWQPDVADLRRKITPKTKAIVMVNPNNPTAALYSESKVKAIIDIAGEYGLAIFSDEIYDLITYDGATMKSTAALARDVPVVTTYSMSKFFLSPGWRIGYLHLHDPSDKMKEFTKALRTVGNTYGAGQNTIPTFIASAAAKVFRGSFPFKKEFLNKLQRSRDVTYKWLNQIDGITCTKPQGSIYAFPRVEGMKQRWTGIEDFLESLAKEEGIAFVPGTCFGALGESHFRTLLLPDSEVLDEVYERLERFMKNKKK